MKKIIASVVCALNFTSLLSCAAGSVVKPTPTDAFLYFKFNEIDESFAAMAPIIAKAPEDTYRSFMENLQTTIDALNNTSHETGLRFIPNNEPAEHLRIILGQRLPDTLKFMHQILLEAGITCSKNSLNTNDEVREELCTIIDIHYSTKLKKTFFERHLALKTPEGLDLDRTTLKTREALIAYQTALINARNRKPTDYISFAGGINEELEKEWKEFQMPLSKEACKSILLEELAQLNITHD